MHTASLPIWEKPPTLRILQVADSLIRVSEREMRYLEVILRITLLHACLRLQVRHERGAGAWWERKAWSPCGRGISACMKTCGRG